jgi:hypothetical protein
MRFVNIGLGRLERKNIIERSAVHPVGADKPIRLGTKPCFRQWHSWWWSLSLFIFTLTLPFSLSLGICRHNSLYSSLPLYLGLSVPLLLTMWLAIISPSLTAQAPVLPSSPTFFFLLLLSVATLSLLSLSSLIL